MISRQSNAPRRTRTRTRINVLMDDHRYDFSSCAYSAWKKNNPSRDFQLIASDCGL
jgi:hypothetical protein